MRYRVNHVAVRRGWSGNLKALYELGGYGKV